MKLQIHLCFQLADQESPGPKEVWHQEFQEALFPPDESQPDVQQDGGQGAAVPDPHTGHTGRGGAAGGHLYTQIRESL